MNFSDILGTQSRNIQPFYNTLRNTLAQAFEHFNGSRLGVRFDILCNRVADALDIGQRIAFDIITDILVQRFDGLCGAVKSNGTESIFAGKLHQLVNLT